MGILCHDLQARGSEGQQLGFLRDQSHVVLLAVVNGEEEKVLEAEDVVGEENTIVCLANAGDNITPEIDSKLGMLGFNKLVVVGQFVEPITVDSPLLDAKLVGDGAHDDLGPLAEGEPAGQPVVQVKQGLVASTSFVGIDNDVLSWDQIKCTFCIKEEDEHRFFGTE